MIPVSGWLIGVGSLTPRAPRMEKGPPGGVVWEPAVKSFPSPKTLNATLPPICRRMFAVGSGTLDRSQAVVVTEEVSGIVEDAVRVKAVSVAEDIEHAVAEALCLDVAVVAKIHREIEVGGAPARADAAGRDGRQGDFFVVQGLGRCQNRDQGRRCQYHWAFDPPLRCSYRLARWRKRGCRIRVPARMFAAASVGKAQGPHRDCFSFGLWFFTVAPYWSGRLRWQR